MSSGPGPIVSRAQVTGSLLLQMPASAPLQKSSWQQLRDFILAASAANMSGTAIAVLNVLMFKYYNHKRRKAWPSRKTLATAVNRTERSVQEAIAYLEKENWLFVSRTNSERGTNEYIPNFAKVQAATKCMTDAGEKNCSPLCYIDGYPGEKIPESKGEEMPSTGENRRSPDSYMNNNYKLRSKTVLPQVVGHHRPTQLGKLSHKQVSEIVAAKTTKLIECVIEAGKADYERLFGPSKSLNFELRQAAQRLILSKLPRFSSQIRETPEICINEDDYRLSGEELGKIHDLIVRRMEFEP